MIVRGRVRILVLTPVLALMAVVAEILGVAEAVAIGSILLLFGRVPSGQAFGTRFFICPAEQIKRAQTMPLSLTRLYVSKS